MALNNAHYLRFGNKALHRFNPGPQLQAEFGQNFGIDDTWGRESAVDGTIPLHRGRDSPLRPVPRQHRTPWCGSKSMAHPSPHCSLGCLNYRLRNGAIALYARMNQFVHLLNEGLALTDLWVPRRTNDLIEPAMGGGMGQNIRGVECSVEGYYKSMDGLLSYRRRELQQHFQCELGRPKSWHRDCLRFDFFSEKAAAPPDGLGTL